MNTHLTVIVVSDLKVIYISGATGTGKTRGILDKHGDGNVYRVNDYEHPFDGYSCQNILAFDEFRSQLRTVIVVRIFLHLMNLEASYGFQIC